MNPNFLHSISISFPSHIRYGAGSIKDLVDDELITGISKVFMIIISPVRKYIEPIISQLLSLNISVHIDESIVEEPTFKITRDLIKKAKKFNAQCIVGIGGGSILDVAKVVAAAVHSDQKIRDMVGKEKVDKRKCKLIALPTTAGTGSEVSPNSILIDEDGKKQGIISQYLIPDTVYIDPNLAIDLPADVTAYTALDTLTHCIEAYGNKNAHPLIDMYALEGIKLISQGLPKAYINGKDIEARSQLALASLYGGLCLGPVNTAAVHALAYPLGTRYKIPHGLSNAILLPCVLDFNLSSDYNRYANIAISLGVDNEIAMEEIAKGGISIIKKMLETYKIREMVSTYHITKNIIPQLAEDAIEIQRLLLNNLREVKKEDAIGIYKKCLFDE